MTNTLPTRYESLDRNKAFTLGKMLGNLGHNVELTVTEVVTFTPYGVELRRGTPQGMGLTGRLTVLRTDAPRAVLDPVRADYKDALTAITTEQLNAKLGI